MCNALGSACVGDSKQLSSYVVSGQCGCKVKVREAEFLCA